MRGEGKRGKEKRRQGEEWRSEKEEEEEEERRGRKRDGRRMEEGEGGKEKGERRGKYVQSPLFVVTQNRAVMNGHVNILIKKYQVR